ncbi:MAG TPA: ATP-binding protein [Hyalangium sp.]|nr:ATP-binding protein [Hyalangium sp.]
MALLLEHTESAQGFLVELLPLGASARFRPLLGTPPSRLEELLPERPLGEATRLDSFLILPLRSGDEQVGLVGLALRQGGDDAGLLAQLQSALTVGGNLLAGLRTEERRKTQATAPLPRKDELTELRQVLTSVEERLWDWNVPGRELRVSRSWRELLGYAEGELEPTISMFRSLCHPGDLPEVDQLIRAHLEGYTPSLEFTYRARHKHGQWVWFLARGRTVAHDSQGRPARVVGTDVDITARKQSEERLRALFRAIPDLLFRMRFDGTFIDWNDESHEATALPPEAFLGKKIQTLPLPRFLVELTLSHVQRVIRDGTLDIFEYDLEQEGRGVQRYEARVVRSGPDEAVCMVRNITERKLVEERQAQLIQAEKLASLGQLAAGIAHEINNPVSYVTSNLNTLAEDVSRLVPLLRLQRELLEGRAGADRALSPEELERLREQWKQADTESLLTELPEIIQESLTGTRRITEIVQSLRSFSHGDTGRPQTVDLNAELESTLRMVWNELKYKCEVIRDFEPLPLISCYPTQIAQVFTNLLVNASHAIERHGEIRIRTRLQGNEVMVAISDTGKGMTPETLSRLFNPFFTTKPRGQGTGLGLSISRDIIVRHGGRIEVQSTPGQGSTFTVYLPTQSALSPGA